MPETILRGDDYPELCESCRRAIDMVADELELRRENEEESIISGRVPVDIVGDAECACMVAYDRGLTCSSKGRECGESDK